MPAGMARIEPFQLAHGRSEAHKTRHAGFEDEDEDEDDSPNPMHKLVLGDQKTSKSGSVTN